MPSRQRGDILTRGLAERHRTRAGFGVRQVDRLGPDITPAQIEYFAAAAPSERQQPDRGDGLGPFGLAGVERAAKTGQLVRIENRATLFLGFLAMPRQGLAPRSRKPHSSARNIMARSISKARLAAPGLSLLAASNHAATSSGPMPSGGIFPNAGKMR